MRFVMVLLGFTMFVVALTFMIVAMGQSQWIEAIFWLLFARQVEDRAFDGVLLPGREGASH